MDSRTRAFIAIELPENVRTAILKLQKKLKPGLKGIRWVSPENIHLTLRFLGDIGNSAITNVKDAIGRATNENPLFLISAKGIGAFPGISRPRVVWVGLGGDTVSLKAFHRCLEDHLADAGIEKESRDFKGHLTIGRVKGRIDSVKFIESVREVKDFETEMFSVNEIILFKSDLTPKGPIYTKLFSAEL